MTERASPRLRALALAALAATGGLASSAHAQLRLGTSPAPAAAARPAAPTPEAPRAGAKPADSAVRQADFIVAVVNSEPITNSEVRARLARTQQQLAQQGVALPPPDQLARQVLDRLISERAQLQLARESGIKVDDAQVDQAEQNVARQNRIDVPELRRRIVAEGLSLSAFRQDLREQLVLSRLRDREVEARVRVTEAEIDQFLRDQQGSGDLSTLELNLAQVLVAVPENATPVQVEALRAKAARVQARARAGEDFAQLAREASDAPDAARSGGAFGLRPADRYPSLFLEAAAALPAGGVSDLVRSGAGFHVLKVLEKRQDGAFSVVQSRARHILLRPGASLSEAGARARLADYKRRIESGQGDFAALAREHSQDGSAAQGGDLGWAAPGMFVPEFEEVMNGLNPGQIAEPFVSRFGVHLLQLVERRRQALGAREQREYARAQLREKKLDDTYERWAQDVRGRAWVEMREPPQ
ncbi:peptidylprolyl isomerase [Ramlibacter sp. MAHUQ-53]|uniref:peptidylprolyl isomerase n=1 Tax=unclassified Ramlibacter TaxID=2617605 RepID=UPI0036447CAB